MSQRPGLPPNISRCDPAPGSSSSILLSLRPSSLCTGSLLALALPLLISGKSPPVLGILLAAQPPIQHLATQSVRPGSQSVCEASVGLSC